jgi:hypothetical protein
MIHVIVKAARSCFTLGVVLRSKCQSKNSERPGFEPDSHNIRIWNAPVRCRLMSAHGGKADMNYSGASVCFLILRIARSLAGGVHRGVFDTFV